MIIENDDYKIWYDEKNETIFFQGSLRLWDPVSYQKIRQMMLDIYALDTEKLLLDFKNLDFMNSSGISTLCKFIFDAKEMQKKKLKIVGNTEILWQKKSFENLKKIWDQIELVF